MAAPKTPRGWWNHGIGLELLKRVHAKEMTTTEAAKEASRLLGTEVLPYNVYNRLWHIILHPEKSDKAPNGQTPPPRTAPIRTEAVSSSLSPTKLLAIVAEEHPEYIANTMSRLIAADPELARRVYLIASGKMDAELTQLRAQVANLTQQLKQADLEKKQAEIRTEELMAELARVKGAS